MSHATKYKDLEPSEKWRVLETDYELDSEFISRYVESKTGKNQQYSAFNDIQVIYKAKKNFFLSLRNDIFVDELDL